MLRGQGPALSRKAVAVGLAAALVIASLLVFWRARAVEGSELGALAPRMEARAADWDAQKVPAASRVFDLVLSDAGSEPLLVAEEPGLWGRALAWLSRTLRPRPAPPSAFAQGFADEPDTLVWTHEGFAAASAGRITRELTKAVVVAHDAGAEVNIVAQGCSAGPVLKALKGLEKVQRKGAQVGVNKVILVGWSEPRLKSVPGLEDYDPKGLGNVLELAFVWVPKQEYVRQAMMQVYSRGREGPKVNLEELYPELAGRSAALADLLPLLRQLVAKVESLERILARQEQSLKEAEAKQSAEQAALAAEAARRAAQEAAARDAEAKRLAQETARKEKAAEPAARRPAQRPAAASQGQKQCAQCCADLGGAWVWGDEDLPDSGGFQVKYGCCQGADWPIDWESRAPCRAAADDGYTHGFRCPGR
ncbi:MAG: hypothetical protein PHU21_03065 [Elusimicrobia bacterium]|nr:hypothetical protein [Elusimicrobiota bacterium]